MAFRANEAELAGLNQIERYFIHGLHTLGEEVQAHSRAALHKLMGKVDVDSCMNKVLGPVIDTYPVWHPLIRYHQFQYPDYDIHDKLIWPNAECGYKGLDHTLAFRNGFITCPYDEEKAEKVIASVRALPCNDYSKNATLNNAIVRIYAERLDFPLYQPTAKPVLVWCNWLWPFDMIPASVAVPLILEQELVAWPLRSGGMPTWETVRPYLLGEPHGRRSSLFVDQETALIIKKFWEMLIATGIGGYKQG